MGAAGAERSIAFMENAELPFMTFGLSTQRSTPSSSASSRKGSILRRESAAAATILSELAGPGLELVFVEPKVLSKFDMGDLVGSGAPIEPAHLDPEHRGRFLDSQ